MSEYGYLIIRNPGPQTRIEAGGLTGESSEKFDSYAAAKVDARRAMRPGDKLYVLVAYDDISALQLSVYDDALDGVLYKCSNCGLYWPIHELLKSQDLDQKVTGEELKPAGQCPECGAPCNQEAEEGA